MQATADPNAALLVVEEVTRVFAVSAGPFRRRELRAVDRVSFTLARGETLGLVGESGCGKSTLGRVILRLQRPTSGAVWFEGENLAELSRRRMHDVRRNIQMVFQDPQASLNPKMTVRQAVAEPLRNFAIARGAEAEARVVEVLDVCGLPKSSLDRYPHEFSGGQRQRIGIARALVSRPALVVADEPVSALDVSIQAQIVNLFAELREQFRLTYVFIAHDLSVVRYISTRVAVMYLGRIVETAATNDLYEKPAHPYTRVLLSSVPLPDPEAEQARRSIALDTDMPSPLDPPSGCRFHTRCPWAQFPLCRDVDPPNVVVGAGHTAACHFAGKLAPLATTQT